MFARAEFDQYATGMSAIGNAGIFRRLRRLPPGVVRNGVLGVALLESWLRWPLATLRIGDLVDETLGVIDGEGDRFGLTPSVKRKIKRNVIYNQMPDLVALMNTLDKPDLRSKTLATKGARHLLGDLEAGRGAIVAGFRMGPYPAFPWALAAAAPGREVMMIVGTEHLAELARRLGRTFIGDLNGRVTFLSAQDSTVLARTMGALKQGGIVATLLELSPVDFQRRTPVRFLDWTVEVPYGFSYLSAATGRPVIPAALARRAGTRFQLAFQPAVAAAERNQASIKAQTQRLYAALEKQVREKPDQWIGWMLLKSNMGIDLPLSGKNQLPAVS